MNRDQDSIGFLAISFSSNVGPSHFWDQIGLFKFVMCGLGEGVVK